MCGSVNQGYVKRRGNRFFSYLLFASWIGFMALAGFFAPSFIAQLPPFKIKEVVVKGNRSIDFESIKSVLEELGSDLRRLNEEEILISLNTQFKNRVKKVYMSRSLGFDGTTLNLRIVERKPVAKLKVGRSTMLIDPEGELFLPVKGEDLNLVEVRTYDIEVLKNNFAKLYKNVLSLGLPIKAIKVKRDRVVLVLDSKEVILPPLELLPRNISGRLKMVYNLSEEKVDLRYDRFILVRN